jgi:CHAT domain-containing protein
LDLGRYPDRPGTTQVFINNGVNTDNPLQPPRPEAVVVIGLGDEGELDPAELASAVCQGVIAWAQRRAEDRQRVAAPFAMAATLLGSGGLGMSAAQSARQILSGVLEANRRLTNAKLPCIRRLDIVELYLDRATEAWCALREDFTATPDCWTLSDTIEARMGALSRPLEASYRGAGYDLLSARTQKSTDGVDEISFVVDTRRARAEVHARTAQIPLIRNLVKSAARQNGDPSIGRTLFRLLVPVELESSFEGANETILQVDAGTAGIPWEMLDGKTDEDRKGDERPWAVRSRLLRKLLTASFRPLVKNSAGPSYALVIGEPTCPDTYPPLPNARAEAEAVAGLLQNALGDDDRVRPILGASAGVIMRNLFERDWRIIHITGHGEPPELPDPNPQSGQERPPRRRGVVLSNGLFLGPDEIAGMPVVPDLVFVNCCHLAKRNPGELLAASEDDRPSFAATLADSLIDLGVRCVIAAGWEIRDDAAAAFATTFYRRLTEKSTFIDAVADAREAARKFGDNTWAAYQCYGDPNWRMIWTDDNASADGLAPEAIVGHIASPPALTLALGQLASTSQYDRAVKDNLGANLTYLQERFAKRWGGIGSVAEAFGAAWAQVNSKQAIEWYTRALAAEDGSASFHAAEQLGNLRVRVGEAIATDANSAGGDVAVAIEQSRVEIHKALEFLEQLNVIQRTAERESMCGSAWKRLALLEGLAAATNVGTENGGESLAIKKMKDAYSGAEQIARGSANPNLFYSALNALAAELILNSGCVGWAGLDQRLVEEIRSNLLAKRRDNPDFWSSVGLIELHLYEALSQSRLAAERGAIEAEYVDLHERIPSGWSWKSPRDQLRLLFSARRPWSEEDQRAGEALLGLLHRFTEG